MTSYGFVVSLGMMYTNSLELSADATPTSERPHHTKHHS